MHIERAALFAGAIGGIVSSLLPSPPTIVMMWREKPWLRGIVVGSIVAALVAILLVVREVDVD